MLMLLSMFMNVFIMDWGAPWFGFPWHFQVRPNVIIYNAAPWIWGKTDGCGWHQTINKTMEFDHVHPEDLGHDYMIQFDSDIVFKWIDSTTISLYVLYIFVYHIICSMHPIWHGLIQMQGVLWLFVTTTKVQTHRSQDQWHMILAIVIQIFYDSLDQTNYSPHVWGPIFLTFGLSKIKTFVFQA